MYTCSEWPAAVLKRTGEQDEANGIQRTVLHAAAEPGGGLLPGLSILFFGATTCLWQVVICARACLLPAFFISFGCSGLRGQRGIATLGSQEEVARLRSQ
jgi:hypothetical protein